MAPSHLPLDATSVRPRDALVLVKALIELCKPRITRMVVVTAGLGAVIAPGAIQWGELSVVLIGTALMVAGANTLNMCLEAKADGLMERTRNRPIPSGRVATDVAWVFGLCLAVLGYAVLARWGNTYASLLAVVAFLAYVFVYTPSKRLSPYALHIGAVPGAIPPLIGWATVSHALSWQALSLFAIMFVWQLPHFMAIALFRAGEYQRAGIRVYPLVKGVPTTTRAMTFWSAVLLLTVLSPLALSMAGMLYGLIAGAVGLAFVGLVAVGQRRLDQDRWAKLVFAMSIPYLVIVFAVLAI
jgi:protoheme IX farnesyltransferase